MLLQFFFEIRKVDTYLHTYLIFWHSVEKRIVMMKIGFLPTQWKSLVLKRAEELSYMGLLIPIGGIWCSSISIVMQNMIDISKLITIRAY